MDDFRLRYPIGKQHDQPYGAETSFSDAAWKSHLSDIKNLPSLLEHVILNLDAGQLATPYRPGGWTLQQVVHHVPDSHMNAYIRFKLALTEDNPVIKPYGEAAWAELSDSRDVPLNVSLTLLHALHIRWYDILKNMREADWQRTVFHPEHNKVINLWDMLGSYAWHGKHHVAQIGALRQRMGW